MTYDNVINILTSHERFHISLGLDRVRKICELIGNPQDKIQIVHVAGTNGKGSVCSILANILKNAGYKTGLYTSPHIFDYTERIKIDGVDISKGDFAEYLENIINISAENNIELTEFEILTVSAFKYFYDNKVDIAVIETGLGGRYDATNIIKKNICSVITSISLDHTDRLGNTIEKIAFEKAGIIKTNCPVVVASDNRGFEVVKNVANEQKSKIESPKSEVILQYKDGFNYAVFDENHYKFNLFGLYQNQNLELVLQVLKIMKEQGYVISDYSVRTGLETINWPYRLQYFKEYNVIMDGSHNPDGARELRRSLDFYFPNEKRTWIYGTISTKDYRSITNILFREEDSIYYYEFSHKNAVPYSEIKNNINFKIKPINLSLAENMLKNMERKDVTIIAGSFYMLGNFKITR